MANMLREALSHMNESSKESASNPTNGTEEPGESAGGGGGLHSVHINLHPDGSHSVHAHMHDGTAQSSKHATHEEALAKAGEHLKAHAGHSGKEIRD